MKLIVSKTVNGLFYVAFRQIILKTDVGLFHELVFHYFEFEWA